jgi:molecular chaperone DnaK
LNQKGRAVAEVHDLEFALATPGARSSWLDADLLGHDGEASAHEPGDLVMRSNLAAREDYSLVPGEVLYRHNPFYFRVEQNPPKIQDEERLYYEPCAICGRASNDPLCRCASLLSSGNGERRSPSP